MMTEGYKMLNLKLVKDYQIGKANLRLAAFTNNALDQVARNSTSFVKDAVPVSYTHLTLPTNVAV